MDCGIKVKLSRRIITILTLKLRELEMDCGIKVKLSRRIPSLVTTRAGK